MRDNRTNVLPNLSMPTRKNLRAAIGRIMRAIQAANEETDETTADKLGVSVGTVRNARNELADLNAYTLSRIGAIYGSDMLDPYAALYDARNVPLDAEQEVKLSCVTGALHHIATATDRGGAINHRELAAMLPALRDAQRVLTSLISRGDKLELVA